MVTGGDGNAASTRALMDDVLRLWLDRPSSSTGTAVAYLESVSRGLRDASQGARVDVAALEELGAVLPELAWRLHDEGIVRNIDKWMGASPAGQLIARVPDIHDVPLRGRTALRIAAQALLSDDLGLVQQCFKLVPDSAYGTFDEALLSPIVDGLFERLLAKGRGKNGPNSPFDLATALDTASQIEEPDSPDPAAAYSRIHDPKTERLIAAWKIVAEVDANHRHRSDARLRLAERYGIAQRFAEQAAVLTSMMVRSDDLSTVGLQAILNATKSVASGARKVADVHTAMYAYTALAQGGGDFRRAAHEDVATWMATSIARGSTEIAHVIAQRAHDNAPPWDFPLLMQRAATRCAVAEGRTGRSARRPPGAQSAAFIEAVTSNGSPRAMADTVSTAFRATATAAVGNVRPVRDAAHGAAAWVKAHRAEGRPAVPRGASQPGPDAVS